MLIGLLFCCLLCGCAEDAVSGSLAQPIVPEELVSDGLAESLEWPRETLSGVDAETATSEGMSGEVAGGAVSEGISGEMAGEISGEEESGIVTITISAAGDVTLGNHQEQEYAYSFRQEYDNRGESFFFQNVKYLFEKDDMTIVNFEGVLTYSEVEQEKDYNMKGDPEYVHILTEGSVEAVSFGNNHRLDYLEQGSKDTVEAFEEAGIIYAYDHVVGIYETKGIRIGIVSVNEASQGVYVEQYLQKGIEKLKAEEADLIIACCHWGSESVNVPEDYQKELGRLCIDLGADLVLGSHPHVLQGIDVYNGKFIVYSLANFCFGGNRNPSDKDTMIFTQTFTFENGEKVEDMQAKVIPCSVSSVTSRNDFCPTPAEAEEYDRILQRINEYSAPFGVQFDRNGNYVTE